MWEASNNNNNNKLATVVEGDQKAPLFNSYYTKVLGRALLLSLDCSTLPLIRTLYCWGLSKGVSSTILKVFSMTRPGIEPRSPGSLANPLPTWANVLPSDTNNLRKVNTRRAFNKFPDFFVWALLLIVHTWQSSPLRSNLLRLQYTCCTVPTTSGRPHRSPLVKACQWPSSQSLSFSSIVS